MDRSSRASRSTATAPTSRSLGAPSGSQRASAGKTRGSSRTTTRRRTLRTGGLALTTWVRGNVATVITADAPPDLLTGVRGPVARIELSSDALQPDDPALAPLHTAPTRREQLLDATCARLLTLQRA